MLIVNGTAVATEVEEGSPWSPLRQPVFRALWVATLISNVGTWMQSTAAAWLMTTIAPDPIMVSLVQTAVSLPVFLLVLPAGALADVIDRRKLILCTQGWMLFAAAVLGTLTVLGYTTPWVLLLLTLLLGFGMALNAPAWQSIVPDLVEKSQIPSAVALNSANFNVARSIGPALGGVVIGAAGFGAAFLINAATYVAVLAVLLCWRRPRQSGDARGEQVLEAMRKGFQFV
ncbi:MAG: MFS transporter, partial [Syntrophobacteraceae bacterium]|nr:MFS transporter [Syntrophobacteraceae bacterium]